MKPSSLLNGPLVLITSLAIGLSSIGLGARALVGLENSYQLGDVLYADGPDLFRVWLERHFDSQNPQPAAIGQRLLAMSIVNRRAVADALTQDRYLEHIVKGEVGRSRFLEALELGLIQALAIAPSSGDLWLAASRIRTQRLGFDAKAEDFLAMSYLMAPREANIARTRLIFAVSVSPLVRRDFAEDRARDLEIVRARYPELERRHRKWFANREARRAGGQ